MLTIEQRHKHSWMAGDWEKISYNDLENKPKQSGTYNTTIQQIISTTTTITITPWFSIYKLKISWYNNWNSWWSFNWLYSKDTWYTIWISEWYYFNWTYIVSAINDYNSNVWCLRIPQYNTANYIRAKIENITSTSFDLNFYGVGYTWYVTVILECYA